MADEPDSDYLAEVWKKLNEWRSREPSVLASTFGTALSSIGWLIDKILPQSAILGLLSGADWTAKQTLTRAANETFDDLRAYDDAANQVQVFHVAVAVAEGGMVGYFGVVAIPADVVAVVALAMRLIRQIGVEYGFDGEGADEHVFVLHVMQAASANTMKEKVGALLALRQIASTVASKTWMKIAETAAANRLSTDAGIMLAKEVAKQLGINLTKRKIAEVVPFVGAAVGAASNGWFIRDVGVAAQCAYQERWFCERGDFGSDVVQTGTD